MKSPATEHMLQAARFGGRGAVNVAGKAVVEAASSGAGYVGDQAGQAVGEQMEQRKPDEDRK